MSKPYVFYINGMTCSSCSNTIEAFLKNSNESINVTTFNVDLTTPDPKKTTIILNEKEPVDERAHQQQWNTIKNIIEDIGFSCESKEYPFTDQTNNINPIAESEKPSTPSPDFLKQSLTLGKKIITSHWFLGALGCVAGIGLLVLTLATGGLPLAAMIPLACVSVLLTLALGARSFYETWKKLTKSQSVTMDTLFTISTITVLAISITAFFVPWLPMMFEAGLLIYGFRHIGIAIEETIKEKISSAQFQDRAPKKVRRLTASGMDELELNQIKPGEVIVINAGEIIPIDGYCEEDCTIYNTIITGAILPRHYRQGEKILAGMRLADNTTPLKVHVLRPASQSYLARLDAGIAQSISEKAPLEQKTGIILAYFVPAVIAIAILSGITIGILFTPALALQCAISVLVSACPCTLGLIIPLAVKTGIHKAAEHGVQFKNSKILQESEQIDTVVFDLNGTLTTGIPSIKHYSLIENSGMSPDQFLALCAAIEEHSTHPIGKAIHHYAQQNSMQQVQASQLDDSHHSGLLAHINNTQYAIGSSALMHEHHISTANIEHQLDLAAGDSLVFLAANNQLIGYFVITDPLRKDATQTIKALNDMGKNLHLCTGADEKTALRYAKALGIKEVHANCVATALEATDKAKPAYINALKQQGLKVAMVGDAANDASALAASDLGIAVQSQHSDELTQQHAGAIIQNGSLLPIASAFAISRQTVSNIKQNLLMSFAYNLTAVLVAGGLLVALGFVLNPGVGVALMVVQACLILLNVYRFKQQSLDHLKQTTESQEDLITTSHHIMKQHTPEYQPKLTPQLTAEQEINMPTSSKASSFSPWNYFIQSPKRPDISQVVSFPHNVDPEDYRRGTNTV